MAHLSREAILAAQDLKREVVDVPEWGEGATVLIGELSGLGRMEYLDRMTAEENKDRHGMALALTFCIINEDGSRVFQESDAELLAGKGEPVLIRLFEVMKRINCLGITEDEAKN